MAGELKALDIVLARYKAQNTAFRMKKKGSKHYSAPERAAIH